VGSDEHLVISTDPYDCDHLKLIEFTEDSLLNSGMIEFSEK
jgi:hypothetical protein